MLRTLILAGAAMITAPAIAQDQTVADVANAAPAPAAAADAAATKGTPEQRALADKAVPPVIATDFDIKVTVDHEWPKYDADGSGGLNEAEFGLFMKAIREEAGMIASSGVEAGRWNTAAFTEADVDANNAISRAEMMALLGGPAAKS